jgi:cyclic beta-1,2-glucan synthetase
VLRFTPLLAEYKDYVNHPAFYKLGLSAKISRGCLIIRRLPRGRLPECFLCLACTRSGEFSNVPGLDTGRFSGERPITEDEFFLTEPYMQCAVEIRAEGAQIDCEFAIALAHSESDAIDCALSALSMTDSDAGDLPRRAACVMGMDKDAFASAWELLPELCFPTPPAENGDYRRGELWKFGVSGDLPILCAHCPTLDELDAARALLDSHLLITGSGTDFDLVLISHDGAAYRKPVNTALHELLWRNGGFALSGARGGVHVVDASDGVDALLSCACRVLDLSDSAVEVPLAESAPALPSMPNAVTARDCPYRWDEQERFAFSCSHALPPRVWANLLTNGRMGYLATDCGSGNMWYLNSRENPLSPWLCQPLASSGPEKLELEYAGERVSLFAGCHSDCRVTFDFGSATWDTRIGSATVETTAFIPPDRDARVLLIRCRGLEGAARIHWSLELDMSPAMPDGRYTLTRCENGVLRAENPRSIAQARALLATSYPAFDGFTCSKASVMSGSYDSRAGMQSRPVLSLTMSAGEEAVIVCSCGDAEETLALASAEFARRELERTRAHWRRCTDMLHLTSPSEELDRLANGWALYQALACRVLGRCSIYQSGGAFGFRDQLQDTVNLIPFLPKLAREQILRSCRRQYLEGDVQHWWHEGDGDIRGVRTRCSDDLLWLPWAVCEYVEKTGDRSILAEKTPYLSSPPLGDAEPDRYECACECETRESVLLHCRRALDMVLRRGTGEHGLLLFGSGDWNDGFDRVRGESQWLTWFFCHTAAAFAALSQAPDSALHYRVAELTDAANAAWDGDWFLRGYYADGKTLGSREDDECRIDSIAQSFAAFCPGADEEKLSRALKSAVDKLYDRRHGLVRLFAPPFTGSGADPGYIAAYGPGFRENGGQYTHAALWLVIALLRTGQPDAAWGLLRAMLPACRDSSTYQAEPFVIAADVYTAPGHTGQAGWSWYTGSSGWFLRTVTEELLGLKLRSGKLFIEPKLPTSWRGCKVIFHGRTIVIDGDTITVDGEKYTGGIEPFPLKTGDN